MRSFSVLVELFVTPPNLCDIQLCNFVLLRDSFYMDYTDQTVINCLFFNPCDSNYILIYDLLFLPISTIESRVS